MLIFVLHPGKKIIVASGLEDFAEKYRGGSIQPEENMQAFMEACATRARDHGLVLATDSTTNFVLSLIATGLVSIKAKGSLQ